ncbi:MAG: hypothetical protein HQK94_16690 [Nitrospirae bacterium]|nr:hypothetical protein [Nitrospirota bacterium]
MNRPSLFIVSHKQSTTNTLAQYFSNVGTAFIKHEYDTQKHSLTYSFIEEIYSFMDKQSPGTLLNAAVIFDYTDGRGLLPENLDPAHDDEIDRGVILSRLIVAYPEVYWIILGTNSNKPPIDTKVQWPEHLADVANMADCLALLKRHESGYRTLFDPSGLRTSIKQTVLEENKPEDNDKGQGKQPSKVKENIRDLLESRSDKSAAILDEELAYTFLHGYSAYLKGYKCYVVTSMYEMNKLTQDNRPVNISLEDLELKFYDMKPENEIEINGHFDNDSMEQRRKKYPFLPVEKKDRIFITGWWPCDKLLSAFDNKGGKPLSGIYALKDLIEKAEHGDRARKKPCFFEKLFSEIIDNSRQCIGENHNESESINRLNLLKQIKGFRGKGTDAESQEFKSHSVTNVILVIGESLLKRARNIQQGAASCPDAIHAAVLALEGKELFYGRAMTTSLEMFSLQQKMEVTAECCFYGVGQQINIEKRLYDIGKTTDDILRIEHNSDIEKYSQSYNAQVEIVNEIRLTFKKYEQFDEEDICIDRIRKISQGIHFVSEKSKIRRIIPLFFEKYFNTLVTSWKCFLLSIMFQIIFFAIATSISCYGFPDRIDISKFNKFGNSLINSIEVFFAMPRDFNIFETEGRIVDIPKSFNYNLFFSLEKISAYIHLGIFIAWINKKLARK